MRHRRPDWMGSVIVVAALLSACGDAAIEADPGLAPFVGDWAATELIVSSPVAPDATLELTGSDRRSRSTSNPAASTPRFWSSPVRHGRKSANCRCPAVRP